MRTMSEYEDLIEEDDILNSHNDTVAWASLTGITFPRPSDININMMPFVVDKGFKTIPKEYRGYLPIIEKCIKSCIGRSTGQIYYLTIQESLVNPGECQRRPGLHTDAHSNGDWGAELCKGEGEWTYDSWGGGRSSGPSSGGIFLASSVANSCAVWDCCIKYPGVLGDCEELRERITRYGPTLMDANRLYWITDRTPHEALPMREGGYRQFFRLVTDKVDVWYQLHSTPNPLGVMPPPSCKIITEDKFGVLLK